MSDIVLTTLNARWAHASFGLRYLLANLAELRERATMVEFDTNQDLDAVAEHICSHNPKVVGLGVYIW
ncbi:MAG: B12-binding domain-containing radical SAM protein, partial [Tepidisphaeraceae bacterium]